MSSGLNELRENVGFFPVTDLRDVLTSSYGLSYQNAAWRLLHSGMSCKLLNSTASILKKAGVRGEYLGKNERLVGNFNVHALCEGRAEERGTR